MKDQDQTERDRQARDIFLRAIEIHLPAAQAAYLEGACQHDASLRSRVEALLENHRKDSFLEIPAIDEPVTVMSPLTSSEGHGTRIGRYKLLQQIGEGGMGVVYMAEQEEPVRRKVALKVIRLGMDTGQVVARFEAERQALALMDHPNIAKVLDAGATDSGRPFFVMELVRGVPITEYCDKNHLGAHQRLELFLPVCHAIQHAHQKGVIHRDIKPSNVLVTLHDGQPVPMVIDFGVAKATNQKLTEKTLFTQFAAMIGTPAYMSPEQAEMSKLDVDTRSDIYSLGVLLYELLTGTTPFPEKRLRSVGYGEMQRIIVEEEPERPSTRLSTMQAEQRTVVAKNRGADAGALGSLFRADLDWIVMKCLEKDRMRRYETANGLAADIQRHLNNEAVIARPPSAAYRFQKLVRRNKLASTAVVAVGAVLFLGAVVSTWQAVRASRAEQLAQDEAQRATREASRAMQAEKVATEKSAMAEEQSRRAETEERNVRQNLYAVDMKAAQVALQESNLGRARELVRKYLPKSAHGEDLRTFEWRYLWQECQGDEIFTFPRNKDTTSCVAFSPDGTVLATAGFDKTVKIWELSSKRLMTTLTNLIAEVWLNSLAFSRNGKMLAATDKNRTFVWAVGTWQVLTSLESGPEISFCNPVAFSPDSSTLATRGTNEIRFWDTATWQLKASLKDDRGFSNSWFGYVIAYSPDGKMMATAGNLDENRISQIEMWDVKSLTRIPGFKGEFVRPECLKFSPEGNVLAAVSWNGDLKLWDVRTGGEIMSTYAHPPLAWGLDFSPDGKTLATAGSDQTIHLWDVDRRTRLASLKGHEISVYCVAYSRDGKILASGSKDGTVKLWNAERSSEAGVLPVTALDTWFSADSKLLITGSRESKLQYWDARTGQEQIPDAKLALGPNEVALASVWTDGRTIVFGLKDGSVQVWDRGTGRRLATNQISDEEIGYANVSPNGKLLATAKNWYRSEGITLSELASGKLLGRLPSTVAPVAFSPEGSLLAGIGPAHTVKLWSISNKQLLGTLPGNELFWPLASLAFSPHGKLLATASHDHTVTLWEVSTTNKFAVLKGNKSGITSVTFSPDGKTVASGGNDKAVRMWNVATKQETLTLTEFDRGFLQVIFSPDGNALAVGSTEQRVRLWHVPSLAEIDAAEQALAKVRPNGHRP